VVHYALFGEKSQVENRFGGFRSQLIHIGALAWFNSPRHLEPFLAVSAARQLHSKPQERETLEIGQ